MVKVISTFGLKPGFDPDECYQLWIKKHVPFIKKTLYPELKGYVIGKVVHSMTGGEFFGAVQLSFATLEDAKRAMNRLHTGPEDEFMKRVNDFRRVVIEERDVM